MEPIIRTGESYTFAQDSSEEHLRSVWLPAEISPNDAGASSRVCRSYVLTEETGGGSAPMVVATAQLHPNHPGAGSHIANAGFMVHPNHEGKGYGRLLAHHVLNDAFADGYKGMIFNAVVETNVGAVRLWQSLGFDIVATIPGAFEHPVQGLVGLHVMYRALA